MQQGGEACSENCPEVAGSLQCFVEDYHEVCSLAWELNIMALMMEIKLILNHNNLADASCFLFHLLEEDCDS